MKIAILYSGSIRTLAETIKNNLDYFNFAEIDLYFSIWDHVGYADRLNAPDYKMSNRITDLSIKITEKFIRNLIPRNVKIKKIKIETYDPNNYNLDLINGLDNNGLSAQYYKILDCYKLLDKNVQYDAVIRLRCDILLNNKIDKQLLYSYVKNNKIIFNKKVWYDFAKEPHHDSINEMIWISNKKIMKMACNIYNNAIKINKIIKQQHKTTANYGENITFMNLMAEKIDSQVVLFNFDYTVLR